MTRPVVVPYAFNVSGHCEYSLACRLSKLLHFNYVAVFPSQDLTDRSQPVFDAKELADTIVSTLHLSPQVWVWGDIKLQSLQYFIV